MKIYLFFLFCVLSLGAFAQDNFQEVYVEILDLDDLYHPLTGSFVLYHVNSGNYKVYNDSVSEERFSPCSTFKIVNSLIALESGTADNTSYTIQYDSVANPPEPWMYNSEPFKHWMQDHTMQTAIQYSVVWYYRELARRIGRDNMIHFLSQIDYGNNDISSGTDNFWLCGSLAISAAEQVEFLRKLYHNKLPGFSTKALNNVKEIIPREYGNDYTLTGKTGGGRCWKDKVIGWYVGWVETEDGTWIFAMNVFADDFSQLSGNKRIVLTKRILTTLNILK
jgi:beta-lactamase class D